MWEGEKPKHLDKKKVPSELVPAVELRAGKAEPESFHGGRFLNSIANNWSNIGKRIGTALSDSQKARIEKLIWFEAWKCGLLAKQESSEQQGATQEGTPTPLKKRTKMPAKSCAPSPASATNGEQQHAAPAKRRRMIPTGAMDGAVGEANRPDTVSYTHLTLPTIYSV